MGTRWRRPGWSNGVRSLHMCTPLPDTVCPRSTRRHVPGWAGFRVTSLAHGWRAVDHVTQGFVDSLLRLEVQAHCYRFLMTWRWERGKKCKWLRITYWWKKGNRFLELLVLKPLPLRLCGVSAGCLQGRCGRQRLHFLKSPRLWYALGHLWNQPFYSLPQMHAPWNIKEHPQLPFYLQISIHSRCAQSWEVPQTNRQRPTNESSTCSSHTHTAVSLRGTCISAAK